MSIKSFVYREKRAIYKCGCYLRKNMGILCRRVTERIWDVIEIMKNEYQEILRIPTFQREHIYE